MWLLETNHGWCVRGLGFAYHLPGGAGICAPSRLREWLP